MEQRNCTRCPFSRTARGPAGRAVLQKRIMALLRKIEAPTPGNTQAWEETFRHWDQGTRTLTNYPKSKPEEGKSTIAWPGNKKIEELRHPVSNAAASAVRWVSRREVVPQCGSHRSPPGASPRHSALTLPTDVAPLLDRRDRGHAAPRHHEAPHVVAPEHGARARGPGERVGQHDRLPLRARIRLSAEQNHQGLVSTRANLTGSGNLRLSVRYWDCKTGAAFEYGVLGLTLRDADRLRR